MEPGGPIPVCQVMLVLDERVGCRVSGVGCRVWIWAMVIYRSAVFLYSQLGRYNPYK